MFSQIFLLTVVVGCTKSSGTNANKPTDSTKKLNSDSVKLVNKNWYWGGMSDPQLLTVRFNSNDTAILTQCWHVNPNEYNTTKLPWHFVPKDSIEIYGDPIKILSITDSILVTTNWVVGGVSGIDSNTFRTY